ncbi:Uncharacterised protein [Staphylococcus caeli]|uniref:Uncharacterized protein n=1 Tax=Staphylococcus caeli TaxID=2201815 RepID=A0A1D4QEN7_9STAP|nr:Uncharacterised protein [Staphylococcus caeli]SCT33593.1 Uncharacterised protein [Staphylococcus caeli]
MVTIFTPILALLKEKKKRNLNKQLTILQQDNSSHEYNVYEQKIEINQKIEQTTSSKHTNISVFLYLIHSLFIISLILNIVYFYNHYFKIPNSLINLLDRASILSYNIFNMFLFALKNSIWVLFIASIIIGISTIILSLLFYNSKLKRLLASITMLCTNLIIWANVNNISNHMLELSENNFQRYIIIVFLMISLLVIATNNILLTCYLFNYLNYSKYYDNETKRFLYIILPLPSFFIIKWTFLDNGYLQIIEFLKNL